MNILQIVQGLAALLSVARLAVLTVETIRGPGSGAEKKQVAVAATGGMIDTMIAVSTGGQKETWEQLKGSEILIGEAVEIGVQTMKLIGQEKKVP